MQVPRSHGAELHLGPLPPMQLIEDKKTLGDKCAAVVAELKQGEQRRQEREAQMREQHALVSGRGARLGTTPPSSARPQSQSRGWCWVQCPHQRAQRPVPSPGGVGAPAVPAPADARPLAGRRSRSSKS